MIRGQKQETDSLPLPPSKRAGMVRLMKMAMTMFEQAGDASTKELAQGMIDQLVEIMPELRDVTPWQEVVQRR